MLAIQLHGRAVSYYIIINNVRAVLQIIYSPDKILQSHNRPGVLG